MPTLANVEKALGVSPQAILSFLQGGDTIDLKEATKTGGEMLCRVLAYVKDKKYHRGNYVNALLHLFRFGNTMDRATAWSLVQETPLSFLTDVPKLLNSTNSRVLRHALVNKLATCTVDEKLRAFFIAPSNYREMFSKLFLPRTVFGNEEITNLKYKESYRLSQMSMTDAMPFFGLTSGDLLSRLGLPFDKVMGMVETPEDAVSLGKKARPDTFFEHARWFRTVAGDKEYTRVAIEKARKIKDPMKLLSNKEHLLETDALTKEVQLFIEERADELMNALLKDHDLESIALLVDVSSSMEIAVRVTRKLYEALSHVQITDLIAFNQLARVITPEQLPYLQCSGMTSIGAAVVLLSQQCKGQENLPKAIILVSDMEENRSPPLYTTLPLLKEMGAPPLIILLTGRARYVKQDFAYPHAYIEVVDFHQGLLTDILRNIVGLTKKIVDTPEVSRVVAERKPFEEELGAVALPSRPKETYRAGYLKRLLCTEVKKC